jgi:hypothetical protein
MCDNYKVIFDFKCFVPEPVQKFLELLQNQEVQTFLNHPDDTEQIPRFTEMVR